MKYKTSTFPTIIIFAIGLAVSACSKDPSAQGDKQKTAVAQTFNYQPQGILAKSLPEIADALNKGDITSEALVQLYLDRINTIDKNGPTLQAILRINPNALDDAKALDALLFAGILKGPLHGVPILLKDNIESKDPIPTTAGALALQDNITGRDSPLVKGLRDAGAIILGKTNLSQWANFRSENSMSGWSAMGGQVRNPHMLDRNPCGSSSGSGAATAASLAAGSVGTETDGSVICPSNANGIVGFKPTVGLVSQQYIIPISASQDTAGPMTKTVMGAAMMMNAMATTMLDTDYTAGLNSEALKGVRVGVLRFAVGNNSKITKTFNAALEELKQSGAILVNIEKEPDMPEGYDAMAYDLLKYEFKDGLNAYLASTPESVQTRTLKELIAFNEDHKGIELTLFDQSIFLASQAMKTLDDPEYIKARNAVQKATRQDGVDKLLKDNNVSVLVAPSGAVVPRVDPVNGDLWPSFPGVGGMAARAGYPHATVPMGGIGSLSVGLSFIGGKNEDANILSYAYAYEQRSNKRLEPNYLSNAEDIPEVAKAMRPYRGE